MRARLEGNRLREKRFGPRLFRCAPGSICWPVDMRSKSLTRMACRLLLGSAGASSGKNFNTWSSTLSLPSAIARPTAVEVKLLLSE